MGSLFNQPIRNREIVHGDELDAELEYIKETAERHGVTPPYVLKVCELLENRRRNDLIVNNGDIWGEQIAGIGELLRELNGILEQFTQEYQDIQEFTHHERP